VLRHWRYLGCSAVDGVSATVGAGVLELLGKIVRVVEFVIIDDFLVRSF
jgi:hypothetical protein